MFYYIRMQCGQNLKLSNVTNPKLKRNKGFFFVIGMQNVTFFIEIHSISFHFRQFIYLLLSYFTSLFWNVEMLFEKLRILQFHLHNDKYKFYYWNKIVYLFILYINNISYKHTKQYYTYILSFWYYNLISRRILYWICEIFKFNFIKINANWISVAHVIGSIMAIQKKYYMYNCFLLLSLNVYIKLQYIYILIELDIIFKMYI